MLAIAVLSACATCMTSCKEDETYAEQKEEERKTIQSFLHRDVSVLDRQGDTLCKIGNIHVISEQQFLDQDTMTNLEKNEYVLFANTGVYMQIVRRGVGERFERDTRKQILCRFMEYNILADSLQLRNDVDFWATNPDIMNVTNSSGTYTASFDTDLNGGGAMYMTYRSAAVPSGWLVPLDYIRLGRQVSEEGIAKVRLIVPHAQGQTSATSNVYPCFYEITYQKMPNN